MPYGHDPIFFIPHAHPPCVLQLALKEHDEKQIYVARQNLHDLLSIYAVLTDILHKNIDKVTSCPSRPMKERVSNKHRSTDPHTEGQQRNFHVLARSAVRALTSTTLMDSDFLATRRHRDRTLTHRS